ncbi:hypothetical protein [Oceanobacillus sp. FSL H7-0719]|uniref:hypothetical protein n=1 Tax=Oceanobacillus sp. FSL H7-0719 TaxID=2954507 RepID=UPI00324C67C2
MSKRNQVIGWVLLFFAIGFFCIQIGYFFVHARFQAEYVDNRLFYIINILCVLFLLAAILLLLKLTKKYIIIAASILGIVIISNLVLLFAGNQQINNITSISPDKKHILSIKENMETNEVVYYRSYYGILARPKDVIPQETNGDFKVEWLAKDIAAVTYKTKDHSIQQYIGTYGDRGGGSYYYVGAEMHGLWQGDSVEVLNNQEGITITENGETELFEWENIHQFGTLAIVLKKNNEAAWTIALNENFEVNSGGIESNVGNISLYKATMEENQPVILHLIDVN